MVEFDNSRKECTNDDHCTCDEYDNNGECKHAYALVCAINKVPKDLDPEQRQRILNLYKGYRYILQGKDINPDTLRELYAILSKDLLCKEDRLHMGEYYCEAPVYIFYSSSILVEPEHGMPEDMINRFMDAYFKFKYV